MKAWGGFWGVFTGWNLDGTVACRRQGLFRCCLVTVLSRSRPWFFSRSRNVDLSCWRFVHDLVVIIYDNEFYVSNLLVSDTMLVI